MTQREELLSEIAKLDRRGYTQQQIAKTLSVGHSLVTHALRKLRKRYLEAQLQDRSEMVAHKIEQYQEIMREAWEGWERSKLDFERVEEEEITSQGRTRVRRLSAVEKKVPGAEYLAVIRSCLKDIKDLLGLDAPKKLTASVAVLDWDKILAEVDKGVPDVIEGRLAQLENKESEDAKPA